MTDEEIMEGNRRATEAEESPVSEDGEAIIRAQSTTINGDNLTYIYKITNMKTNVGISYTKEDNKVEIQFEKPNKQRYNAKGTAFLVGKSSILTAAHCVYEKNDRVVSGTFYPAQNGTSNRPYTYTCGQIHIPTKYKTAINNNDTINSSKYDYALIKLNQSAGTTLGFFALGGYNTNYNANNLVGMEATVVGYPGEKAGMMYRHKGLIQSFNSDKYLMNYQMDTTAGQSGSPVILPLSGGRYFVVGIHILGGSTKNSARYITKNIYELVKKYE